MNERFPLDRHLSSIYRIATTTGFDFVQRIIGALQADVSLTPRKANVSSHGFAERGPVEAWVFPNQRYSGT